MDTSEVVRLCKALGDETRFALLQALIAGPKSVSSLVKQLGKSQPAVSIALQKLATASVVRAERQGNTISYSLNPKIRALIRHLEVR